MTKGRSIRLFLADGTPGGIITAEIMNWTGHVIVAPRSRLADLIQRPEAGRTGVYILTGADPEGDYKPLAYIGETDNVGKRLAQHNKDESKEFWEQTCIVTSKDQNLTKAHARYLESRLIAIATEAARTRLENGTAPDFGLLPEADLSDMEFFIDQLRVVLPVLGLDFLKEPAKAMPAKPSVASETSTCETPLFELFTKKYSIRAEARETNGEFIVLAGSQAQDSWIAAPGMGYYNLFRQLVDNGVLVPDQTGHRRFGQDFGFKSPSAASATILGRPDNGRTSWRLKGTDKTYAQWQEDQVAAATLLESEE
ncbi:GIY-YIG nuclease family protein [Zavarzinia compransoris]|uniref:DUF4357 domain-containing protein n=1 Tax=Zavarzinia compransoris TaxID=1264899 RepID=A0A317DY82_9PROT|nr:GIY-YIG nuclease family protein [Zavarzinia compransoris]PWR19619.1 DUF4357 domain-containing protein [Zavarzinia compransoris]TDP40395.1 uncharacterized protein DUF4357 [Zavarzinia compransoris]